MHRHQHDVHDVHVAVAIHVVEGRVVGVADSGVPAAGYQHDVGDVHVAVAVQVARHPGQAEQLAGQWA